MNFFFEFTPLNIAIKYMLNGSNIMCPGLTSAGGEIEGDIEAGTPVLVFAEGMEPPLCMGEMAMSAEEVRTVNAGVAINMQSFLGDGLWTLDAF